MTDKLNKTEAGEKPAVNSNLVELEVISPMLVNEKGVMVEKKVGDKVKISKENAAIFSSKLAEVGFSKSRQARKENIEVKLSEVQAKLSLAEKELAQSKATNVTFKAEIERLRALVK